MTERSRSHRVRRIVLRVVVFLLLGAIVNVAVAWGLGHLDASSNEMEDLDGTEPIVVDESGLVYEWWNVTIWRKALWTAVTVTRTRNEGPGKNGAIGIGYFYNQRNPNDLLPYWTQNKRIATTELQEGQYQSSSTCVGVGWPLRAFWCAIEIGSQGQGVVSGGLTFGVDKNLIVPIRPIWPGFAINTMFYAAILWLLFAAPGRVRRWRRTKLGLCPKCVYPKGASEVCTECGTELKKR